MKLKLKHLLFSAVAASSIIGATASVVACGTPPKNNNNNGGYPVANATQQGLWNNLVDAGLKATPTALDLGIYSSRPTVPTTFFDLPVDKSGANGYKTVGGTWVSYLTAADPTTTDKVNSLIKSVSSQTDMDSFQNAGGIIDIKFEGAMPLPEINTDTSYYENISASTFSIMLTQNGKPLLKVLSQKKVFFLLSISFDDTIPPTTIPRVSPKLQSLFDQAVGNALKTPSVTGVSTNKTDLANSLSYNPTDVLPTPQDLHKFIFKNNMSDLDALIKSYTSNNYLTAADFMKRGNTILIGFKNLAISNIFGTSGSIVVPADNTTSNGPGNMFIGFYNGDHISIGGIYSTVPMYVNITTNTLPYTPPAK